eukprot:TRINITY_DN7589_c0_g1_i2.p1 TRINITY_DN7589_c0_g1~~TRINITY_DN7589_c0_g1_i2.p1  ORF type:complete len:245 (-),score=31.67 TRINITY_DN7589_c0_g1_i2:19-663(-)
MGAATRDDLVLDEKDVSRTFFRPGVKLILEEKVDGANLGISIGEDHQIRLQNRSHYVSPETAEQWKGVDRWISEHPSIYEILTSPNIILFGEWLHAKHSIHYTRLPSTFMAFDIYDKSTKKFWSVQARDEALAATDIPVVRCLGSGHYTREQIIDFVQNTTSQFYDGPIEGVYIRVDEGPHLVHRGKVVRADFIGEDARHWSKNTLVKNVVVYQ